MVFISDDGQTRYNENAYWNKKAMIERKSVPCMDCGLEWHPMCMTLDHVGRKGKYVSSKGKRMHPNKMLTYNPVAFASMLQQLDPICSNCHKIRENKRDRTIYKAPWTGFTKRLGNGALLEAVKAEDKKAA